MKKSFVVLSSLMIMMSIVLTGCVSRRDAGMLKADKSYVATDSGNEFTLQLPTGYKFEDGQSDNQGRVVQVIDNKKKSTAWMQVEITTLAVDRIVSEIKALEDVTLTVDEEVIVNGLTGRHMVATSKASQGATIEFFLLAGKKNNYLLSSNSLQNWVFFDQVARTFQLVEQN